MSHRTGKGSETRGTSGMSSASGDRGRRVLILIAVVSVFAVLFVWKVATDPAADPGASPAGGNDGGVSITSVRNDAVADFEVALEGDKPIYVLFHSLTCVPCVEISEVADAVVPEYEDQVTFVNVITDHPSGQELARRFSFQYIPTSFFLAPDGTVVDSYTGAMDEGQMRSYLETLIEDQ